MLLQMFQGMQAQHRDKLSREASWSDLQKGARVVWTSDGQPVRQIAPRSRLPVGRYNSRKAGRLLHHQSRGHGSVGGEKLALMKCEIDPTIVDFRSQHVRFDLFSGGIEQVYFPDIISLMHDGTVMVIEVKKDGRWQTDTTYHAKIEAVRDICADLGWLFEVWTQASVAPTSRVRDNIVQIQMQRFVQIADEALLAVDRALRRAGGRMSIGDIKALLGAPVGGGDLVRGLMCRGKLRLPLDEVLTDGSVAALCQYCSMPAFEHAA